MVVFINCLIKLNVCRSLGLAIPPRVRFLQKWKKAREAKKKEKETLAQTMVEDLNEKLNKSSDSEVSEDDIVEPHKSSFKDTYDFHNGNILLNFCNCN